MSKIGAERVLGFPRRFILVNSCAVTIADASIAAPLGVDRLLQ
ncbi:hypothetical protein [Bradyrhizobium sp.]|nr:hypothetical protein [Bradyrhizobium sp.]